MIVPDLDVFSCLVDPAKDDAPFVVDPDTVETFKFTLQRLQTIARNRSKIFQRCRGVDVIEPPLGHSLDRPEPVRRLALEDSPGLLVSE
jgi:hypothetical protein